jgi:hypothetical protein
MAVIDDSDPEIAEAATRDAMQAGADVIYQARLSVYVKVGQNRDLPGQLNLIPD